MKVAAIDIGSNSIHMVIAETGGGGGSFAVIDREKDMVKLGAGCFAGGRLSETAFAAGLHTLRKMRKLCERHRVDDLVCTATSAVREAANGGEFLAEVERQTGIPVQVITGDEESRLIYLAVRNAVDLASRRALIIDVGGGSVEIIVGDARSMAFAACLKLGVQRLRDRLAGVDPLSRKDRKALQDLIRNEAGPALRQARDLGFDVVVGTSGSILAVGGLAHLKAGGQPVESPNNLEVAAASIEEVAREIDGLDAAGRAKMKGVDPNRVDTIHLAAILCAEMLELAGAKEIVLCNRALREGLILDYLERNGARVERGERVPDIRRRGVLELLARASGGERFERHHHHVARLALSLFDQMRPLHGLGAPERRILELAALVHDIGAQIAFERHERHSYYLIRNADLAGLARGEIDLVALVARYHRGPAPRKRHRELRGVRRRDRRIVRRLAAILRVADGLDRSHFQSVRGLKVRIGKRTAEIGVEAPEDAELEIYTARRKGGLFERVFGRTLEMTLLKRRPAGRIEEEGEETGAGTHAGTHAGTGTGTEALTGRAGR